MPKIPLLILAGALISANNLFSSGLSNAPILLLETRSEFGAYTEEILRAEGFNEFQVGSPSDSGLTVDYLEDFDVVILTETTLSPAQCKLLTNYVRDGGNLIAIRPDKQLAPLFGISATESKTTNGYVRIEGNNDIGKGLPRDTLQFHGDADDYDLKGGRVIASLFRDASNATGAPAVVTYSFGKGHAIVFTYNLAKSIVFARQGNELYAGLEKDGIKGIRATDMFTDGWIDSSKAAINQADEQMRLLSRAIESLSSFRKPLPRLWYFHGLNKGLVILTADGEDSSEEEFDNQLADIRAKGARLTLYLKGTYIPASKVKHWLADGFEISSHVDDTQEAIHPTYQAMDKKVNSTVHAFKDSYGIDISTVRNHWITWCGTDIDGQQDFAAQAAIEANYGIGLDCNLYHYDRDSNQGHFLGPIGNFTGSGLPMKFIDPHGQILNIYESITQLPDEQWLKGNLFSNFKVLLDRSLDNECYTFINVNLHTDRWREWSRPEGLEILDYANSRRVPIWTAEQTLRFLQAKAAAQFSDIRWSDNQLSFQLDIPRSDHNLTVMVPKIFGGKAVSRITRDGETRSYTLQSIKRLDYAFVESPAGNHRFVVTYAKQELEKAGLHYAETMTFWGHEFLKYTITR